MLKVQVEPHVNRYEPGSEAMVKIAVTDHEGIPVSGDVALAAYDESVLAIQPEGGIGPKEILLATKTLEPSDSWRQFYSSLGEHQFDSSGDFVCPEYALALEKFHGPWTATDRSVEDEAKEVPLYRVFALGGPFHPQGTSHLPQVASHVPHVAPQQVNRKKISMTRPRMLDANLFSPSCGETTRQPQPGYRRSN